LVQEIITSLSGSFFSPFDHSEFEFLMVLCAGRVTDENEYVVPPGSAIQLHGAAEFGYLLHGTLETRVYEAVNLPNMDMFSERVRVFAHDKLPGPLEKLKKATGVHGPTTVITSDPYTVVVVAGARVARTRVINNNANPKWNEHFLVPVAHHAHHVTFVVKDQDVMGSQLIGKVTISAKLLLDGGVVDGWFDVLNNDGKPCHAGAKLRVSARYHPVEHTLVYAHGAGTALGVPNTYFPLRKGCRLTLYQDAHVYDDALPNVMLDGGLSYNHGRCWEDISTAIHDAQHLVYIVGWSVWDKVALVRDVKRPLVAGGNLTLGELLKHKARQGVRVLLLLWDDKSSHDLHFVKTVSFCQSCLIFSLLTFTSK
jgi:phospholipase D1/2